MDAASKSKAVIAVGGFMTCSSLMLIVNKAAIGAFPWSMTLLASQLFSSAVAIRIAGLMGLVDMQGLEWPLLRAFAVPPALFLVTLFANMKILQHANVETFIVVRASTPLATSLLDWLVLGRQLPCCRSWCALLLGLASAIGYMRCDSHFEIRAYSWAAAWYAIFLFDQIVIKHVLNSVEMTSWTRAYYTNAVAFLPALAWAVVFEGAPQNFFTGFVGPLSFGTSLVALSCALGTAMSYFSYAARSTLSATSFTLTGNVCKLLSIVVNVVVWDKHASAFGLVAVALGLAGSVIYRQAPLREAPVTEEQKDESATLESNGVKNRCSWMAALMLVLLAFSFLVLPSLTYDVGSKHLRLLMPGSENILLQEPTPALRSTAVVSAVGR